MRAALWCGVVGPVAFVAAWVVSGLLAEGFSPVDEPISRLAASGAATQPLMTAGFVVFGLLLPVYARELGRTLGAPGVRVAASASGLATLAVACTPLSASGGTVVDLLHYVFALAGYTGQTLAPVLGARALPRPALSRLVGLACGACLVASVADTAHAGLWQRLGLGLVDVWFVVLAVRLLRQTRARA